jgi:KaiC/GvpD/RAD55 family RecA-like ATPase
MASPEEAEKKMIQNHGGSSRRPKAGTGIARLDQILSGGFPVHRQYLVEGGPGTGKTALALQFLLQGREQGEQCLYMTLSETQRTNSARMAAPAWLGSIAKTSAFAHRLDLKRRRPVQLSERRTDGGNQRLRAPTAAPGSPDQKV